MGAVGVSPRLPFIPWVIIDQLWVQFLDCEAKSKPAHHCRALVDNLPDETTQSSILLSIGNWSIIPIQWTMRYVVRLSWLCLSHPCMFPRRLPHGHPAHAVLCPRSAIVCTTYLPSPHIISYILPKHEHKCNNVFSFGFACEWSSR